MVAQAIPRADPPIVGSVDAFNLTLLYNPLPSGSANTIRTSSFADFRNCPIPEIVPPVPTKISLFLFPLIRVHVGQTMETNGRRGIFVAGKYAMGPKR